MINANTDLYCIFGNPVRHTLSPLMHNAAFEETGINAAYLAFEPGDIADAIQSMKILNIAGASVTIPFKIEVMQYLDDIDPLASAIGSVNTLLNRNGKISGFNTDGYGAVEALLQSGSSIDGANVLIIGNGGSSRAIAFTLLKEGARVNIAGRNLEKVTDLCNDLERFNNNVTAFQLSDMDMGLMEQFNIVINTTPIGMYPKTSLTPIDTEIISPSATVFDIIYSPHETELLKNSSQKGCKIVHGIDMLLYQGTRQFELWTGQKAPVETMKKILQNNIK